MERGIFAAVEGPDGAGKSTIVAALAKALKVKGISVITTTEPTKTETGKEIRRVLASDDPEQQGRLLALYLQDRSEHNRDFIRPNLEKYDIVLTDRYKHSTIVYQSIQGITSIKNAIDYNSGFMAPDITFILFDSMEKLLERMDVRDKHKEFLESTEILEKSIDMYMNMHNFLPNENIIYIYNSSIEKTINNIINFLDEFKKKPLYCDNIIEVKLNKVQYDKNVLFGEVIAKYCYDNYIRYNIEKSSDVMNIVKFPERFTDVSMSFIQVISNLLKNDVGYINNIKFIGGDIVTAKFADCIMLFK